MLDITAVPTDVSAPAGLSATLGQLQRALGGAVAVLTGRQIEEVDRLLALGEAHRRRRPRRGGPLGAGRRDRSDKRFGSGAAG